jgi:hypothetical protein
LLFERADLLLELLTLPETFFLDALEAKLSSMQLLGSLNELLVGDVRYLARVDKEHCVRAAVFVFVFRAGLVAAKVGSAVKVARLNQEVLFRDVKPDPLCSRLAVLIFELVTLRSSLCNTKFFVRKVRDLGASRTLWGRRTQTDTFSGPETGASYRFRRLRDVSDKRGIRLEAVRVGAGQGRGRTGGGSFAAGLLIDARPDVDEVVLLELALDLVRVWLVSGRARRVLLDGDERVRNKVLQ